MCEARRGEEAVEDVHHAAVAREEDDCLADALEGLGEEGLCGEIRDGGRGGCEEGGVVGGFV